jgi:hypothetical protein
LTIDVELLSDEPGDYLGMVEVYLGAEHKVSCYCVGNWRPHTISVSRVVDAGRRGPTALAWRTELTGWRP